jgi:hypothetical protein
MVYLAKQRSPTEGWKLESLGFAGDSSQTDSNSCLLEGHFISTSRFNPKFTSDLQRHVTEWKTYGRSFCNSWASTLPEFEEAGTGIRIMVEYKSKNYLRPNDRLRKGVLSYLIEAQEIKAAGGNSQTLFNGILKKTQLR